MLEVRTNDCYAELLVNGEFVVSTVDMEFVKGIPKLAHKLGIEYTMVHGEWTREQKFVPTKRV